MYNLNEHGRESINTFLDATAKPGFARDAFLARAQTCANDFFSADKDAILELAATDTQSGNAESLQLLKSWFDVA